MPSQSTVSYSQNQITAEQCAWVNALLAAAEAQHPAQHGLPRDAYTPVVIFRDGRPHAVWWDFEGRIRILPIPPEALAEAA
jgi:hypothetical protein